MKEFHELSKKKQSKELKNAKITRKKMAKETHGASGLAMQKIREKNYKKAGGRTAK